MRWLILMEVASISFAEMIWKVVKSMNWVLQSAAIRKKGNIFMGRTVFAAVLVLLALVSNVLADSEDSTNWYPLSVGNKWLYGIESFTVADNDSTFYTGTRQCEITDLLTHEAGFLVYELLTITTVTPEGSGAAESYADTTIQYLHRNTTELRCYNSPALNFYDVWISFSMMNSEMEMQLESSAPMGIRVEPSVTVPAGSFSDCTVIVYPAGDGSGIYDMYYHHGTGPVKTVYSTASFCSTESLLNCNVQ